MVMGMDWGRFWAVLWVLWVFGFGYNLVVGWLEREGLAEGYVAWLVVLGVLVTMAGVAVVDAEMAMVVTLAFCASGFWMVIGSWWRHVQARKAGQRAQREEVGR